MQTFSLTTIINNTSYSNITLKECILILSEYFAIFGDNSEYIMESEETGELICNDTLFTQSNHKEITFEALFELIPYWNIISPILL